MAERSEEEKDSALRYLDRLHRAAAPHPGDEVLRAIDAISAMCHVIASYSVALGLDTDDLLDMVEEAYFKRRGIDRRLLMGPTGDA